MTMEELFKLVPARQFFTKYCTGIPNYYQKTRGYDGNRTPITFTAEDKKLMKAAAKKLAADLSKVKF